MKRNRFNKSRRFDNAVALGDVIQEWVKLHGLGSKLDEAKVRKAWADVMPKVIVAKTRKITVSQGAMMVELDSAPLKEEFAMSKGRIADMINEHLGKNLISRVIIR